LKENVRGNYRYYPTIFLYGLKQRTEVSIPITIWRTDLNPLSPEAKQDCCPFGHGLRQELSITRTHMHHIFSNTDHILILGGEKRLATYSCKIHPFFKKLEVFKNIKLAGSDIRMDQVFLFESKEYKE
jgi:hypothetical protein